MASTNGEQIKFHGTDDPIAQARSTGQRDQFRTLGRGHRNAEPDRGPAQLLHAISSKRKSPRPSARTKASRRFSRRCFPIESYDEKIKLEFGDYEIGEPKLSPLECQRESQTFAAPLYVTFRLREDKNVKEERVYMGELPLMAPQGTFIINGAERVVVSQLHRSPGICFESSLHANGKVLYSYRIIPDRGSWLEVMYDTSDLLYVHLDRRKRRRKFLATTFLRALGYSTRRGNHQAFLHHLRPQAEGRSRRRGHRHQGAHRRNSRHRQRGRRGRARLRAADPGGHPPVARSPDQDGQGHRHQGRRHDHQVPQEGPDARHRGGAEGHLPPPASRRSANRDQRQGPAQAPLLRSEALRHRPRRPLQDQPEALDRRRSRDAHHHQRGHRGGDAVRHQPAPGRGEHRRHRSPRQPPRPHRRRTSRQPVPHGPVPHGTAGQGAHDAVRREHRRHDAAEADQPEGALAP